ncbi:hypothetical protein Aglo01_03920 [Actinokineospora globicatena]|nr:hypothetical protein Aglo01_03920 [Actinokineospora globicatena]GLW82750.1 hypothetical protein Aglo02_03900 [Actinokineospora globicatena]
MCPRQDLNLHPAEPGPEQGGGAVLAVLVRVYGFEPARSLPSSCSVRPSTCCAAKTQITLFGDRVDTDGQALGLCPDAGHLRTLPSGPVSGVVRAFDAITRSRNEGLLKPQPCIAFDSGATLPTSRCSGCR